MVAVVDVRNFSTWFKTEERGMIIDAHYHFFIHFRGREKMFRDMVEGLVRSAERKGVKKSLDEVMTM